METSLEYILKVSGVLLLFFTIYQLVLRKETFFKGNRHFLLAGIVAALIFPFVYITKYIDLPTNHIAFTDIALNSLGVDTAPIEPSFDWMQLFFIVYGTGVLLLTLRFCIQLLSLYTLIGRNESKRINGYIYVETTREITPFSFFNYIVYNPALYRTAELDAIIRHEKAHSSQWHSIDILIAQFTAILFWVNPMVWFYKKSIQQNLEFLADAYATQDMPSLKTYQYALVKGSANQFCTSITNNFYNSLIKKRIVMLQKSKSNKTNLWKYSLVIPLLIAFVSVFNTKVVAQNSDKAEIHFKKINLVINKNTSDAALETMKKDLAKDGIDFSYTIVHSKESEIINISIHLSGKKNDGSTFSSSYNSASDSPIKPLRIIIDDNKNIFLGNIDSESDRDFNFTVQEDRDGGIKNNQMVIWSHASDDDHKTIEIADIDGKEVIKVNGKVVTKEEYEKVKDDDETHFEHISLRKVKGKKGKNVSITKDYDHDRHIEIIDNDGDGHMVIDIDSDKDPLFIVDGKVVSKKKFKKLSPDEIKNIDFSKGEGAISKYGKKAKNGVVEIRTKKN